MNERTMLDLFSGLGGASEAMLNHGWEVLRIENNPELSLVPNTKIKCVYDLGREIESNIARGIYPPQPTLIWASFPCTDFSDGFNSPKSKARRAGEDYYPQNAIDMALEAKRIVEMMRSQYWIFENVRGSIEFLEPIFGKPAMIIDSIVLWGKFPKWTMPPGYKHLKDDSAWSTDPMRANKRALIPYAVSDACRQSIENTKTLDYWF